MHYVIRYDKLDETDEVIGVIMDADDATLESKLALACSAYYKKPVVIPKIMGKVGDGFIRVHAKIGDNKDVDWLSAEEVEIY